MEIRYEKSFEKDLYKISDNEIKKKVKEFIKYVKNITDGYIVNNSCYNMVKGLRQNV